MCVAQSSYGLPSIQFVETLEGIDADLLILRDAALQEQLDRELKGAITFNLKRSQSPVWMTTNGAFSIPRIVLPAEHDALAPLVQAQIVVVAVSGKPIEQLAFELLLSQPLTEKIFFVCPDAKQAEAAFASYGCLLAGIISAKELIAAPSNWMPPDKFAEHCQLLTNQGVHVTVLDEKQLSAMGAEAILAVGRGSSHPPKMVIMEWRGSDEAPVILVGKGICFDSGGINLKTTHLVEMKWDKAGAGVVVGVLDVISQLKTPIHLVGIAVLAENMPDGAAMKPGDIISTLGGKSVEIIDTDCEGRLALADGLAYAQQHYAPRVLIDLGTLTLETFGALGGEYAGLFCNDETLSKALIQAGESVGEKLWPLPLGTYYANQVRSKVADLKNVGVFRYGASSAAAEFLRAFVQPNIPWAHIDISGTAWKIDAPEAGVTGFGIRLLINYLVDL